MKTFLTCALLILANTPLAAKAEAMVLSNNTRVEVVASLTTRELWNTTKPISVEAGNIIIDSRMFDSEAKPRHGKWRGCALVMVGTGDIGMQPVAIRVWTVRSCNLSIKMLTKPAAEHRTEFNMRLDSKETLKIRVDSDLKVTVGNKAVGQIES